MRTTIPIADLTTYRGKYLSPIQLALYVGVTRRTIYTHIDKGALRATKIGGVVRIRLVDALIYCGEDRQSQHA